MPTEPTEPTDHERYLKYREKWTHEDNLLNQRVTWLLLSQTLLFATYGVSMYVAAASPNSNGEFLEKARKLLIGVPWFGIVLTIVISAGLIAAISAQQCVKRESGLELHVSGGFTWIGYVPPIALPIIFIGAWLLVLVA